MYKIRYLPLARKDLTEIIAYISDRLKSPKAAMDLLNSFDESISKLGQFPYMFRVYRSIKELENEYRLLPVNNYAIFYMVKKNIVEIHRIVYAKMDLTKIIK